MLKLVLLLSVVVVTVYAFPILVDGGWSDVSIDDEEVVAAADYATKHLSEEWSDVYHHRLVKIIKAKKQVVGGMNYKLDMIIGKTTCRRDEVEYEDAADCDFQEKNNTYKKCQLSLHVDQKGERWLVSSGCILISKKDI